MAEQVEAFSQLEQAKQSFASLKSQKTSCFSSKHLTTFWKADKIQTSYTELMSKIPCKKITKIGSFFDHPALKMVQTTQGVAFIFTPCYLMLYHGTAQKIDLIPYQKLKISCDVTTELLKNWLKKKSDDEVKSISWQYEKNDGSRDLRYRDNEQYIYVYRGKITLSYQNCSFVISFNNKSKAEEYEKEFLSYIHLLNTTYADLLPCLFDNHPILEETDGIQKLLLQIEEEKDKKAKEMQERLKREALEKKKKQAEANERLKKEKEEERKRKAEEEKKNPELVKKRREEELLRNIVIRNNMLTKWLSKTRKTFELPTGKVCIIGEDSFRNANCLKSIIFPEGITEIRTRAFYEATALEKITIPQTVKKIGKSAFYRCKELKDISLPTKLTEISEQTFAECTSLKKIVIPPSVTVIRKQAFYNCTSLTEVILESGLCSIEAEAFAGCTSLQSIVIPNSLKSIENRAFADCKSLTHVTISEQTNWKKKHVFEHTPWLKTQAENGFISFDGYLETYIGTESNITLPKQIKVIGENAFRKNSTIISVDLPHGMEQIDSHAFFCCPNLRSVHIPESVTQIADDAFIETPHLTIKCTRGSIASAFRIEHKIPVEYISKEKPKTKNTIESPRGKKDSYDNNLSGLTSEEFKIVMELRRKKLEQKKTELEKQVISERINYQIIEQDPIFNIKFKQTQPVSDTVKACEYEAFLTNENGQTVSNIKTITADGTNKTDLIHRVTFTLSAQKNYDKDAPYFLILRYKGADTDVLCKVSYSVNIAFTSDFDF